MSQLVYTGSRTFLRCAFWLGGGLTVYGREHVPGEGRLIVACNHASHLDPMILGAAFDRPLHFMARRTLFDVPVFRWLIHHNNAFPLDREGDSREALRVFGERLEMGNAVVMFPEGTRSPDGALQEMKLGLGMLAVRNNAPVLPVYNWGSYQAWPRRAKFPRPHRLKTYIGEVIVPDVAGRGKKEEQRRVTEETARALGNMERLAWEGEKGVPEAVLARWAAEDAAKAAVK